MELARLERERRIAVQNVIMSEKMVEQAKADVARLEGRILEREVIDEEKKAAKTSPQKKK